MTVHKFTANLQRS